MATVIESDLNRYEVVKVLNPDNTKLNVQLSDTSLTSKGRLRTSSPETTFFNTFQYGTETDVWETAVTSGGTATHDPTISGIDMAVTSVAGSQVIRQTHNTMKYIPGRSSTLSFAVRYEAPVTGIRRRVGLFNGADGFYFENDGSNYACVIINSNGGTPTINRVLRANWNGDKLDGTGPSGIVANATAQQLISMDYEWYGAGQVVFQYVINGQAIVIHTFNNGNITQGPWCKTPFLPIRCELTNVTGASGTHHLYQGSNSLITEGTTEYSGVLQSHMTAISGITLTSANTFYPVLSIRLKSTTLQGIVLPKLFQTATTDNTSLFYKLIKNATLTQGTWTNMPDSNSFSQYLESPATGTTALSGGITLDNGIITGGSGGTGARLDKDAVYQIGRSSLGTVSDTLTLAVASANTNKSAIATITWIEQR